MSIGTPCMNKYKVCSAQELYYNPNSLTKNYTYILYIYAFKYKNYWTASLKVNCPSNTGRGQYPAGSWGPGWVCPGDRGRGRGSLLLHGARRKWKGQQTFRNMNNKVLRLYIIYMLDITGLSAELQTKMADFI